MNFEKDWHQCRKKLFIQLNKGIDLGSQNMSDQLSFLSMVFSMKLWKQLSLISIHFNSSFIQDILETYWSVLAYEN